ncbi:hypothetical protein HY637_03620 [Candidatus Woesearchaeota archaeon]|nr:hypothetical protein [Candidatus Woesearchaeota archaeon]
MNSYTYKFRSIERHILAYPKFLLLFITFVVAYLLFTGRAYYPLNNFVISIGYLGMFIAGAMFAYGFTAAPATAMMLIMAKELNIVTAGLIGGLGALAGDLIIFSFIRLSFADEIKKLSHEKIFKKFNGNIPIHIKKYVIPVFAGFIIASPLPDEIGVTLLAAYKHVSVEFFMLISYVLNTIGIFFVLYVGTLL